MIQIDVDDRAIQSAIEALRSRLTDLSPAFREVGSTLVDEIRLGFKTSTDPWGVPWKRLAWKTQVQRMGGLGKIFTKTGKIKASKIREAAAGLQPLLHTGKLRSSITFRLLGKQGVEVGTSDYEKKAAHHQFGSKKTSGRGSGVPARPFLPIRGQTADLPERWREQVLDILRDHLGLT